ncbi:MAG: type I-E CRISPR-associated endoribonuclease Cas2 [Lachnospiraceae bacterium]|nr:type I-E CRISPR-associated endoribonuclease Cas2 [Lachnospiraceae bacterium]
MITINVTNCPQNLRGDLTKWLIEIDSGVYVGKVNAKVRDELWKRVCNNIKSGQAVMVYSTNNEQGYDFKVHNSERMVVDYDGINLVKIPIKRNQSSEDGSFLKKGFSKATKYRKIKNKKNKQLDDYVIVDIETTGVNAKIDHIIEIGALKVSKSEIVDEFQCLIKTSAELNQTIISLTGITQEMLNNKGIMERDAIEKLFTFIDGNTIVGYNVKFDIEFLDNSSKCLGVENNIKKTKDLLNIARRKIDGVKDYKLINVARHLSVDTDGMHRALRDCYIMFEIINELNKI